MASRNRGKATREKLLARLYPPSDDESFAMIKAARDGSPTAAAILGASFVEFTLEQAVKTLLVNDDDETWSSLTRESGPISTFYHKILIGFSLGAYNEGVLENLKVIQKIRNHFAHPREN